MERVIIIRNISLIFFASTGLLHFSANIFIANSLWPTTSNIIYKTLDIPFIITGLIYAFSSLRLKLSDPSKNHRNLDITLISITSLALVALLVINLLIPDL